MAAERIWSCGPDDEDYGSWTAWDNNEAYSLTGADEIAVLENYTFPGGLVDDDAFNGGWVTDGDRFIILRAAVGHEATFADPFGKFFLKAPATTTTIIRPVTAVVRIDIYNIAFDLVDLSGTVISNANGGFSDGCKLRNVIVKDSNGRAFDVSSFGAGFDADGVLVINPGSDGIGHEGALNHATVIGAGNRGIVMTGGSTKNCLVFGTTNADYSDQGGTLTYLAGEDGTIPGTPNFPNRTTDDFVNHSGGDYRTAGASSLSTAGEGGTHIGCDVEPAAPSNEQHIRTRMRMI